MGFKWGIFGREMGAGGQSALSGRADLRASVS